LNIRTYVRAEGKPGVFFLSIQAAGALVAWLARTLSPLDYRTAALELQPARSPQTAALGSGAISFRSPFVDVDFASGGRAQRSHRRCRQAVPLDNPGLIYNDRSLAQ
jgi:hypothetical protein